MNYQTTPDQNTLTIDGKAYVFVESVTVCSLCAFHNEDYTTPWCYLAPCVSYTRTDQQSGYFQEKK